MRISVTRALRELKTLDKRITSAITELQPLDLRQAKYKGKTLRSNVPLDEFEKKARGGFQSIQGLLEFRRKVKAAIVKSNAESMVKICGQEMTVAEVLETKNVLELKKRLLDSLRRAHASHKTVIDQERERLDTQVQKLVEANIGKDRKTDREDFDKIARPFIEANEVHLVDPLKIQDKIEALDAEITKFEDDVDIVLSESNAKTEIEITD